MKNVFLNPLLVFITALFIFFVVFPSGGTVEDTSLGSVIRGILKVNGIELETVSLDRTDGFTQGILLFLNTPLFHNFMSTLDVYGRSTAELDSQGPMPPGSAGTIMHFAYALNNPYDFVSNTVAVEILP